MMENKNNTTLIVIGVIVAIALAGFVSFHAGQNQDTNYQKGAMNHGDRPMECGKDYKGMHKSGEMKSGNMNHADMTMDEMTKGLEGLTGDEFDKAFVEMMIVHHQGAVDMAKEIPANAKHPELKKLGEDIVTAQTKEIEMMKGWLKRWGYDQPSEMMKMDSGMMRGMQH
jgi:uncharacterized protein (DUF305 family)